MRIVSLAPFLTEILLALGLEQNLVGVSGDCLLPEGLDVPRLTPSLDASPDPKKFTLSGLADAPVDKTMLMDLAPTVVLASLKELRDSNVRLLNAKAILAGILPDCRLESFFPRTLEQILAALEAIGKITKSAKGHDLSQRMKAQIMDWGDNFYDRMKNKRVTFLSSVQPLRLAGYWIPDLVHACSAVSQLHNPGEDPQSVEWKQILEFRPDVIIVAPEGQKIEAAMKAFKVMEKFPDWESVPAVKRGEVVFTDGFAHFYSPSPALRDSMSILVSAIAGFESGYIAPRDSFYRLRWLELQRHKF